MLANIAHHQPASGKIRDRASLQWFHDRGVLRQLSVDQLFDELHMSPRGRRQLSGVVIALPRPFKTIGRQLIPLFASHLASLAANGQEPPVLVLNALLKGNRRSAAAIVGPIDNIHGPDGRTP